MIQQGLFLAGRDSEFLRADKPWWWRQRKLHQAAQAHGAKFISHAREGYGPSLAVANREMDKFYAANEKAALEAGR